MNDNFNDAGAQKLKIGGLTLITMRHCEDDRDNYSGNEDASTLTKDGRKQAETARAYLKENGLEPDYIICAKDLVRVHETLEHMGLDKDKHLIKTSELLNTSDLSKMQLIEFINDLQMIEVIEPNASGAKTILVLARRPAVPDLVKMITNSEKAVEYADYDHGAMSVVDFPKCNNWTEIPPPREGFSMGNLREVIRPNADGSTSVLGCADAPQPPGKTASVCLAN